MKHMKNLFLLLSVATITFLLSSCVHSRKVVYFHDLNDTIKLIEGDSIHYTDPLVQTGDILDIYVSSFNPEASAPFNLGGGVTTGTNTGGSSMPSVRGYRVERDGTIRFPVIGKVQVAGKTTTTIADSLESRLNDYLKDPVVNIHFLNFKVTILGEVGKPTTYIMQGENPTLIDALGMAGDLSIYGKRQNILVIREEHGKRVYARLDLTSSKVFNSPFYYLKQNDIVYVEPIKAKSVQADDKLVRAIGIVGAALSLIVSAIVLFKL